MKVGSKEGDLVGVTKAKAALTVLFVACVIFCGVLFAQEIPETDIPETATVSTPAVETPPEDIDKEPTILKEDSNNTASRLEQTLKQNNKCLKCHSKERSKLLEDGKEMSLLVHQQDYLGSAHGEVKCVSCHRAIGQRKHPSKKTNITINSEREYSVEMNESCRKCHRQKYTQYKGSVHSAMVSQGSTRAPVCTSCHSAHAVESMADYKPENGYPCKNCHENIFNAYSASVHGQARINGNTIRDSHIQAPICADCHHSHEVTALAIGDILRTTCIACHENVTLLHNQWLPNAGTHLDIVSCAVCHAPFAKRRVDLHLYDNVAQLPVSQQEGNELLQEQLHAVEKPGGGVDPIQVWKTMEESDQQGQLKDISLRSRMEVMSGVAAHQIANKSFAVRTCDSCHETDSRKSQNVTVSITRPDGRTQSFEADREALNVVGGVNSISDFYALGGNPNRLLDYLLLLSLASGFAIPIGHFTMGKIIKKFENKGEQ